MRVVWTDYARNDLDDIVDYIAQDNPAAAIRMADRILDRSDILNDFPESGRPGKNGRRELVVAGTPYVIFYRIRLGQVEILAVMHGARDR